jgi:hypothetical protein
MVGLTGFPIARCPVRHVRFILVVILCFIAVIGQTPVWYHVASCDDCVIALGDDPLTCSHPCCHQHEEASKVELGGDRHSVPDDSGSCAVCQSLACPVGVGWTAGSLPFSGTTVERVVFRSAGVTHDLWNAAPRPRGPPLSA